MGWSVEVIVPEGFPKIDEPIVSFSHCPGNTYMAVSEMQGKQLRTMDAAEAINALKELIAEVDKGDQGRFNNTYAVVSDVQWSKGRETEKNWDRLKNCIQHMPFKTYEEYCGYELRTRIRETAVRFFLYYAAGYKIEYQW